MRAFTALDLEAARRILYLGPFLFITDVVGLSPLDSEKIFFWFTTFLAGISAYYAVYKFLSLRIVKEKPLNQNNAFIVAAVAGFFYVINPFYMQKVALMSYGFSFSYAMIPLVFYFFDRALASGRFKYIFLASVSFSLAVAGTMQFLILLPVLLLIPWFIITLGQKTINNQSIRTTVLSLFAVAGMFLLVSSYWIVVAAGASLRSGTPEPGYVLTELMLNIFSSNNTTFNAFRLFGVWWPYIAPSPITDQLLWVTLGLTIPILAISLVVLITDRRIAYPSIAFLLIAALIIFFYKGTNPPLGEYYLSLYAIPIFGWMFRVPDLNGIFLPFALMMTLALGTHGLLGRKQISKYLRVVPILILIPSTSILSWQLFTGDYGGIYKDQSPYAPSSVASRNSASSIEVTSPTRSFAIVGGGDLVDSLHSTSPLTSSDAILFVDKSVGSTKSVESAATVIITDGDEMDPIMHFLPKESITLEPFEYTFKHNPNGLVWSRASTSEPLHGPFRPYLAQFSLNNQDFDYGKGLVFTWSKDTIAIPFNIESSRDYTLFIRYLENPSGGLIELSSKGYQFQVNTRADSTSLKWEKIGSVHLVTGSQEIRLTNLIGFNAVNLITLVPSEKLSTLADGAKTYFDDGNVAIILEAEDDFVQSGSLIGEKQLFASSYGNATTFHGTFKTPADSSLMAITLQGKVLDTSATSFEIANFTLKEDTSLFSADFENESQYSYLQFDERYVQVSYEKSALSNSVSLRADVFRSDHTGWVIIRTADIPVSEDGDLVYSLKSDEQNMNELHGKIVYYDQDGKEILVNFVDIDKSVTQRLKTPKGTDHLSIHYWFKPNPETVSSFHLDDILLERVSSAPEIDGKLTIMSGITPDPNPEVAMDANLILHFNYGADAASETRMAESRPVGIAPNSIYEYDITLGNVNSPLVTGSAKFYSVGSRASLLDDSSSNGVLTFDRSSEVFSTISVLKPANYTIAVLALKCNECGVLHVTVSEYSKSFRLDSDVDEFQWLYLNASLAAGESIIKIRGDYPTAIDRVILYSDSNSASSVTSYFSDQKNGAIIRDVNGKSPVEYEVSLYAGKPFLVILDEKFNGLWTASVGDRYYDPIRVEPNKNGFFISETGNSMTLTIKYLPEQWLTYGLIITLSSIVGSISVLILKKIVTRVAVDHVTTQDAGLGSRGANGAHMGLRTARVLHHPRTIGETAIGRRRFIVIPLVIVAVTLAIAGVYFVSGDSTNANWFASSGLVVLLIACIMNLISFRLGSGGTTD
jgi:hypothetical protein